MSAVGLVVFLAGIRLVWQARREVFYWLEVFFSLLRASLQQANHEAVAVVALKRTTRTRDTLRLVGGFGLIVLGQALFILDLVF